MTMLLHAWQIWIIAALTLIILELITTGFITAIMGASCCLPALLSALGFGYAVQALAFSFSLIIMAVWVRPIFLKYFHKNANRIKTNVDALIGRTACVTDKIDFKNQKGRIQLGGENWKAMPEDHTLSYEVGTSVTVVRVDGCTLIVK
jgi:membrane protein implicated in regulation of membrane protease activity